jgi:hypothetical protein
VKGDGKAVDGGGWGFGPADFWRRGLGAGATAARGRVADEGPGAGPGAGVGLRALDERRRRVKRSKTCVLSGPSKGKMVGR